MRCERGCVRGICPSTSEARAARVDSAIVQVGSAVALRPALRGAYGRRWRVANQQYLQYRRQ